MEKKALKNIDPDVLGFSIRIYSIPFFCIPFILDRELMLPLDELNKEFWISVIYIGLISYPLETLFYYKALQKDDISLVLPILSIYPMIATILAVFILNEVPNIQGVFGICITTFGIYILKIKHINRGILGPIVSLKNNTAIRYMFIVVMLISLGTIVDKIALSNANVYLYGLISHLLMSVPLLLRMMYKSKKKAYQVFKYYKQFLLIGLIIFSYTTLYLLALEATYAGFASAIKSISVLFTIIFGVLIFKEKDVFPKIIGGLVITVGLIVIKIA